MMEKSSFSPMDSLIFSNSWGSIGLVRWILPVWSLHELDYSSAAVADCKIPKHIITYNILSNMFISNSSIYIYTIITQTYTERVLSLCKESFNSRTTQNRLEEITSTVYAYSFTCVQDFWQNSKSTECQPFFHRLTIWNCMKEWVLRECYIPGHIVNLEYSPLRN